MEQRCCSRCDRTLSVSRFAKDRYKASGYKSHCKDCDNAKSRAYYAAHREARAVQWRESHPDPRPCRECGGPIARGQGNSSKRYCTPECRAKAKQKRERQRGRPLTARNSAEVECIVCGHRFRKRNKDIREWPKHCCSSQCKALSKRTKLSCDLCWVSCLDCRKTWLARNARECVCRTCHPPDPLGPPTVRSGPICWIRSGTPKPRRFIACRCENCGEGFLDFAGLHPATYRFCPACKPTRWKKDRERAKRYGVAYEPIDRRKLYQRDSYRCGICGEQTDPDAPFNSPRSPTLDHIVPVSKGGPHLYSNVQCACFECNWRKADGTDTEPRHGHRQGVGGRGSEAWSRDADFGSPLAAKKTANSEKSGFGLRVLINARARRKASDASSSDC